MISSPDPNRTSVIVLDEGAAGEASVAMKEGDKFFLAIADAARACSAMDKFQDFGPQFGALLRELYQWVQERRHKITSASLALRKHDLLFLVMQKGVEFDESLSRELTELDLRIANSEDYSLIDLEVLSVPEASTDACTAFLSSGQVFHYAE
jgi:hypothetical protein